MPAARRPLIIGHRGAPGYRPEHTSASYELAFELGADAVEPDIVSTRDGVLVIRHENEISSTTDVAEHPEFAARRTTKSVDGQELTGWFTEDFSWAELSTLRAKERLPKLRPESAAFDGRYPILRLSELFERVDAASERMGRPFGIVAEIKHASYFEGIGLPLDELFAAELAAAGWTGKGERLVVESFERTVLGQLSTRGVPGKKVYLMEAEGAAFDQILRSGPDAHSYAEEMTAEGLRALAAGPDRVDGVSVDKVLLLNDDGSGAPEIVENAHAAGLEVFCWTFRPENRFLSPAFRRGDDPAVFGEWRGEFRALLQTGVNGVFADHPDLAFEARNTFAGA